MSLDASEAADRKNATLVSVVIVTFNSADVIASALHSVLATMPNAEIIVVDNGSTDNTCSIVTERPRARLIAGHRNVGFGAGANLGAEAAAGRLLLVINPDAFVMSADVATLYALAERGRVGMLGCKVREGGRDARAVQARWGWRRELCWALIQWYLIPREVHIPRPRPRRASNTWVPGAAFVVDRNEFLQIGGFDERLFLYYEDFDLSRTYAHSGLPLASTDAVTVDHVGHASSPRDEDRLTGWALMSLIEHTAKWDGLATSRTAAIWAWRLLGAIEMVGKRTQRVPWVRHRGRRKSQSAARLRGQLLRASTKGLTEPHYPLARAALRTALGTKPEAADPELGSGRVDEKTARLE
jgi:hypothetical protein